MLCLSEMELLGSQWNPWNFAAEPSTLWTCWDCAPLEV